MRSGDVYPSKFLKAEDLDGQDLTVTIKSVELEKMQTFDGSHAEKPVVSLVETDKKFVCNKTNWSLIAKVANSDESDDWKGVKITLYCVDVEARGDVVSALRVRLPAKPRRGPAPKAAAAGAAEVKSGVVTNDELADARDTKEAVQQFWRTAKGYGLNQKQGLTILDQHGGDFGAATAFLEADNAIPPD